MAEEKKIEERDMTGWSEEEIERGSTFTERFMRSCREAKAMREGRLPSRSLKDFFARMEAVAAEEEAKEKANDSRTNIILRG